MDERRTMSDYRRTLREDAEKILGEKLLDLPAIKNVDDDDKIRRAAQMSILYHDHSWSLERVGQAYNLSRERVRQIFAEYDLPTRSPMGDASYSRPFDRLVVPPDSMSDEERAKRNRILNELAGHEAEAAGV